MQYLLASKTIYPHKQEIYPTALPIAMIRAID